MKNQHIGKNYVVIALMLFFALPVNAEEPSLAETLAWIDNTYNPHEGGSYGYGLVDIYDAISGRIFKTYKDGLSYSSCTIKLSHDVNHFDKDYHSTLRFSETDTFNLGDIDPSSIEVEYIETAYAGIACQGEEFCDSGVISFETRNKAPLIKQNDGKKTFVDTLHVSDIKYTGRLAKAFKRAVLLCGGKPSTF